MKRRFSPCQQASATANVPTASACLSLGGQAGGGSNTAQNNVRALHGSGAGYGRNGGQYEEKFCALAKGLLLTAFTVVSEQACDITQQTAL
jgi:hypothetical protein